jgi:hypothetical protein
MIVAACTPIGKFSKQQPIAAIAVFISMRFLSKDINFIRRAERHTAASAWASSGSAINILV